MRGFLKVLVIFGALVCTADAFVAEPTNVSANWFLVRSGVRVKFRKLTVSSDSADRYKYWVVRWTGIPPSASNQTILGSVPQAGDTNGSWLDRSSVLFLPSTAPDFSPAYSYSVYTAFAASAQGSDTVWEISHVPTPVTVFVDTVMLRIDNEPPPLIIAKAFDTIRYRFHALRIPSGSVTFSVSYSGDYSVRFGIDSYTGDFWAVRLARGITQFVVDAVDNNRHSTYAAFSLATSPQDTVRVQLFNAGTPLAAGIRCYAGLFALVRRDSFDSPVYRTLVCDSTGAVVIVCDSGAYRLRLQALGYKPAWVDFPGADNSIKSNSSIQCSLIVSERHFLSGTVIEGGTDPVVGALITNDRGDSCISDTGGEFRLSVAEGDSLVHSDSCLVWCIDPKWPQNAQWYNGEYLDYMANPLSVENDQADINFQFPYGASHWGFAQVWALDAESSAPVSVAVSSYRLHDGMFIFEQYDTVNDSQSIHLPRGKYLLYASPLQQGHFAGYSRYGRYAPLWTDADTIVIDSVIQAVAFLNVLADSNIAGGTGGSRIYGSASDFAGRLPLRHLILYRLYGGDSDTDRHIVKTSSTDYWGSYEFEGVPPGRYCIHVDLLDGPSYDVFMNVDSSQLPIHRDLVHELWDVPRPAGLAPAGIQLFQNYPNPFHSETCFFVSVPARQHVTVSVYSMIGELIATVVDADFEEGLHSFAVDGQLLPSGVFCVRLHTAAGVVSRTMMVVH